MMNPLRIPRERADYFRSMKITRFAEGDRVCDDEAGA